MVTIVADEQPPSRAARLQLANTTTPPKVQRSNTTAMNDLGSDGQAPTPPAPGLLQRANTMSLGKQNVLKRANTMGAGAAMSGRISPNNAGPRTVDMGRISFTTRVLEARKGGLAPEEAKELAAKLNERINEVVPEGEVDGWFTLFKEFDGDESGLITFEELQMGIRVQLQMDEDELPEKKLKAMWISLDEDDSGFVESAEFHRFMERKEPATQDEERRQLLRQSSKQQRAILDKHKAADIRDQKLVSSVATEQMRAELDEAGVAVPEGEVLKQLAVQFAKWCKTYMPDTHIGIAWLQIFKEVDDDESGLLTYDELRHVVRRTFKVKRIVWSENLIKALWCALDVDNSDSIARVEFGRFVKLAGKVGSDDQKTRWLGRGDEKLLEARAGGLSPAECKSVAAQINQRIDEVLPGENWFELFKAIDVDASGLLSFDEFKLGVRDKMELGPDALTDKKLMALWISLDEDDSGYVESAELHRFLNREEPKTSDEKRREMIRQSSKRKRALLEKSQAADIADEKFKSSVPTAVLEAELKAKGIRMADDAKVREMSVQFAIWVKEYLPDDVGSMGWLKVFKQVDNDSSGLLTYDELKQVIRRKFNKSGAQFSDDSIKLLWCALDQDQSDSIAQIEFGRFMKVGTGKLDSIFVKQADDNLSRLARGLSSKSEGKTPRKKPAVVDWVAAGSTLKVWKPPTPRQPIPKFVPRRPTTVPAKAANQQWTPRKLISAQASVATPLQPLVPPKQIAAPPERWNVRDSGQKWVSELVEQSEDLGGSLSASRSRLGLPGAAAAPVCAAYLPRHGLSVFRAYGDHSYYVRPPPAGVAEQARQQRVEQHVLPTAFFVHNVRGSLSART